MEPQAVITVYFSSSLLVLLVGWIERRLLRRSLTKYVAAAGVSVAFAALLLLREGVYTTGSGGVIPPSEFEVDKLSKALSWLFNGIGLASAVYSFSYMKEGDQTTYYTLILLLLAGLTGSLLSNDLFTFYCFWELAAASAYSLVAFKWWHWEPVEAAFKYLVACTLGALTTLYATALLYGLCGTTNLDEMRAILAANPAEPTLSAMAVLFVVGLGTTAAVAPFHMWLPDAHSAAPSPVSALLSGVVVNVPLFMLAKILLSVLPPTSVLGTLLIALGALSSLVGNVAALAQLDAKRLLAYSTVANVGYVLLGVGACHRARLLGVEEAALTAIAGAFVQLTAHAFSKSLLFLSIGGAIEEAGSRLLASLEGCGLHMPITGAATLVALANLIGIPPMFGYYGKALIVAGLAHELSDAVALAALVTLEVSYALAAGYYAYLAFRVFRRRGHVFREAPAAMLAAELSLAATIAALSVYPNLLVEGIRYSVASLLG